MLGCARVGCVVVFRFSLGVNNIDDIPDTDGALSCPQGIRDTDTTMHDMKCLSDEVDTRDQLGSGLGSDLGSVEVDLTCRKRNRTLIPITDIPLPVPELNTR